MRNLSQARHNLSLLPRHTSHASAELPFSKTQVQFSLPRLTFNIRTTGHYRLADSFLTILHLSIRDKVEIILVSCTYSSMSPVVTVDLAARKLLESGEARDPSRTRAKLCRRISPLQM